MKEKLHQTGGFPRGVLPVNCTRPPRVGEAGLYPLLKAIHPDNGGKWKSSEADAGQERLLERQGCMYVSGPVSTLTTFLCSPHRMPQQISW